MKKLIFDTSAINKLAADSDRSAIVEGLCIAYHVGITATVAIFCWQREGRTWKSAPTLSSGQPENVRQDFMERCVPFTALLVALCFSQYDR